MPPIAVPEAQARLEHRIREASRGEEVVISTHDGVAVRRVPVQQRGAPRFGSARGLFTMSGDFDAPLDDFAPYER